MNNPAFTKRDNLKKRAIIQALEQMTSQDFSDGKKYCILNIGELEDLAYPILVRLTQDKANIDEYEPNIPKKLSLRDHIATLISERFAVVESADRHKQGRSRNVRITPTNMNSLLKGLCRWEEQATIKQSLDR